MQAIARQLGRAASTISREVRRNAATRGGGLEYRATTAQWHADRAARRPKPAKLALNPALRTYVEERLASSSLRTGLLFPARQCPGKAVGTDNGKTGDGQVPGARSRSPVACWSISQTMEPCASAMKPSIKRSSFRAGAGCAVN